MTNNIIIENDNNSVTVSPFGAHVLSWLHNNQDVLFLSKKAIFDNSSPIRGGVPVIFPQFGALGGMLNHGFARISNWQLASSNDTSATFVLRADKDSSKLWKYQFEAVFKISLTDALNMNFSVTNNDTQEFDFTAALHTYFKVGHIDRVLVKGLDGLNYIDSLDDDVIKLETSKAITIGEEVDRIYLNSQHQQICDLQMGRHIHINSQGFSDAVLWNPWIDKSKRLNDFGDEEYKEMLCIEAALIDKPVTLAVGQTWQGSQTIKITSI